MVVGSVATPFTAKTTAQELFPVAPSGNSALICYRMLPSDVRAGPEL
jgi:hypothetical protein